MNNIFWYEWSVEEKVDTHPLFKPLQLFTLGIYIWAIYIWFIYTWYKALILLILPFFSPFILVIAPVIIAIAKYSTEIYFSIATGSLFILWIIWFIIVGRISRK